MPFKKDPKERTKKAKRARYAQRACILCRRRKVRCSGDNPCSRCRTRKYDCVYDDPEEPHRIVSEPKTESLPPSDAAPDDKTLLSRLTRVETALAQARVPGFDDDTPQDSAHSGHEGADFSESPHSSELYRRSPQPSAPPEVTVPYHGGDTALENRIERLKTDLEPTFRRMGILNPSSHESHFSRKVHLSPNPIRLMPLPDSASSSSGYGFVKTNVSIAGKNYPFPRRRDYLHYLEEYFKMLNASHPCLNEPGFRERGEKFQASSVILDIDQACFLALNYMIFAVTDLMTSTTPPGEVRLPGWKWFAFAEEVAALSPAPPDDYSQIQTLSLQSLYLLFADQQNAAYNVAGAASRLCFQFGLHLKINNDAATHTPSLLQFRKEATNHTPYDQHMRQRVFWTVYYIERRISQVCGRPYAIKDNDISVELPADLNDHHVYPGKPLPPPEPEGSIVPFLSCMVLFARWSGEIWDRLFAAGLPERSPSEEAEVMDSIDAQIAFWSSERFPHVPNVRSPADQPQRHEMALVLIKTRMLILRILLRRSLHRREGLNNGVVDLAIQSAEFAVSILDEIRAFKHLARSTTPFRYSMSNSLGIAIISLASCLVRMMSHEEKQIQYRNSDTMRQLFDKYKHAFKDAIDILHEVATCFQIAWRISAQLEAIANAVLFSIQQEENSTSHDLSQQEVPQQQFTQFNAESSEKQSLTSYSGSQLAPTSGTKIPPSQAHLVGNPMMPQTKESSPASHVEASRANLGVQTRNKNTEESNYFPGVVQTTPMDMKPPSQLQNRTFDSTNNTSTSPSWNNTPTDIMSHYHSNFVSNGGTTPNQGEFDRLAEMLDLPDGYWAYMAASSL